MSTITFDQVHSLARGTWERIHRALGISLQTTSHQKHTPCPGCGGRDRFRVTKLYHDTGGWICSQGGEATGGDGFALVGHVLHMSPAEALRAVARECGLDVDGEVDREEMARRQARAEAQARKARAIIDAEQERLRQSAIYRTRQYLAKGTTPRYHPYLDAKMLTCPHQALAYMGRLVIPVYDARGAVAGCQLIFGGKEVWENREWSLGDKFFLSGTAKKGNLHWLDGEPDSPSTIAVCEGWATGASLVEPEIGHVGPVSVAFDAGNIVPVVQRLLVQYPGSQLVVYCDDDKPGAKAGADAVALDPVRVSSLLPQWPGVKPDWATDFNDLLVMARDRAEAAVERAAIAA